MQQMELWIKAVIVVHQEAGNFNNKKLVKRRKLPFKYRSTGLKGEWEYGRI